MKIKFDQSRVEEIAFSRPEEVYSPKQLRIFAEMGKHLSQHLDLDLHFILSAIIESTQPWMEKNDKEFSYFDRAMPQERVYIANVMKERLIQIFNPLLLEDRDTNLLLKILEKALKMYIDNYAGR